MPRRLIALATVTLALATAGCAGGTSRPSEAAPHTTTRHAAPSPPGRTPSMASPDTSHGADRPPPYIRSATWVQAAHGRSLHIVPTAAGRRVNGGDADAVAWREVLKLAPDSDTPGMKAQFECHWTYARLVEPDKPSWNIEPWRPVVSERQLAQARCNPGGPD